MNLKSSLIFIVSCFLTFTAYCGEYENISSLIEKGKRPAAIKIMQKASLSKDEKVFLTYRIGEKFFFEKKFGKASDFFLKIVDTPFYKKKISWNLSLCFFYMKEYEKSFSYIEKIISDIETDKKLLFASRLAFMLKKYDLSFTLISKVKNKSFENQLFMAKILLVTGKEEQAKKLYKELLGKYKLSKESVLDFINFLQKRKIKYLPFLYMASLASQDILFKAAFYEDIGFFKLASRELIKKYDTWYRKSLDLYKAGLYKKALYSLKKALKFENGFNNYEFLAKLYFLNGEYADAAKIYEKLSDTNNKSRLLYHAGEAYLMAGFYGKAENCFLKSSYGKGAFAQKSLSVINYIK